MIHGLSYTHTWIGEIIVSFRPLFLIGHIIVFSGLCIRTRWCLKKKHHQTPFSPDTMIIVWLIFLVPTCANIYFVHTDYAGQFWEDTRTNHPSGIPILYANILKTNRNYEEIKTLIMQTNPTIIFFAERQAHHTANVPLLDQYPYTGRYRSENVIFSKIPFTSLPSLVEPYSGRFYPRITITLGEQRWRIDFVHTTSPTSPRNFRQRNHQLTFLVSNIQEDPNPYLILGDFNVTPHSSYYKQTLGGASGLTNVSMTDYTPRTRTFGNSSVLPAAHIDHVFVSNADAITNFRIINLKGSDHHAFFFHLTPSSPITSSSRQ
ncbi:MAG: endonuclease/exonuclease/phosphatase family protein [Candidatus Absconditabacterales bacterium]|nr:endonuclease/exonuclease/phosphatase family protein [Candidatus Absconditabacterales bacterium]